MASTTITIRMDEDLKRQAEALFDDLGLNMTTAFTVFAKAAVREQKIPFDLSLDPFFGATNQARLKKAIADLDAGKGQPHKLIEVDDENHLA